MKEAPVWQCEFAALEQDPGGGPLSNLTVGSKFQLNCKGEIAIEWPGPARVVPANEQDKHNLVVLKVVSQDSNSASYIVTSYRAGEHRPDFIRMIAGDRGFETSGLSWTVKSVLPTDRKPEPYPSFGPYTLNLPIWVWGVVLAVVLVLALITWRIVRRVRHRNKVKQLLASHDSALPPHSQFHKDLRVIKKALDRQEPMIDKLDNDFRLYLLRSFRIPALDWSNSEILRDLRKQNRLVYDSEAKRLAKVLRELTQMKRSDAVKVKDLEQMFKLCRDTVDRMEKLR